MGTTGATITTTSRRKSWAVILTVCALLISILIPLGGQAAYAANGQLVLEQLPMDSACQGLAKTGTPPFDATDGEGLDSGSANCLVRVNDSIFQNYSVSLTGLDAGQSANNVVLEFTIHPGSGAKLRLTGPLAGGMPDGCLSGAGINPASSQRTNADGSVTVICNQGTMSSNVAVVQLVYEFAGDSPIPSTAYVTAKAYTADPLISPAPEVTGPVVEVTGTAAWEIKKLLRTDAPHNAPFRINRADGPWIRMVYWLDLTNQKALSGGSDLEWPATFYDRLSTFPNAIIDQCYLLNLGTVTSASGWSTSCPTNTVQGPDGWPISLTRQASGSTEGVRLQLNVLIPARDFYRTLDPDWVQGDLPPSGAVNWQNALTETDGWHLIGGHLNNPTGNPDPAPGFEPGWDGVAASGDNIVNSSLNLTEPRWDLAKSVVNSQYQERDTDLNPNTPPVRGFIVTYRLAISESNGTIVSDTLDAMDFTDVLSDVGGFTANAIRTSCGATPNARNAGTIACSTTTNGRTTITYTPSPDRNNWDANGNDTGQPLKNSSFDIQFFIPVPELPPLCTTPWDKTYNFTNEARDTEGWTAGEWPINRTGLEPGWDPATGAPATGNNITTASIRFNTTNQNCGTLDGDKRYEGITGGLNDWSQFTPGDVVNSHVWTTATAEPVTVGAPMLGLCDVFDVSVWRIVGDPLTPVTGADPNPHLQRNPVNQPGGAIVTNPNFDLNNYVIEYAVGTNSVNTQTGTGNGLNAAINTTEAAGCRENPGPWSSDPAAAFGADWRDKVNMVRVRPKDPDRVEAGPFTLGLYVPLQARWQYNGGPNAGQTIPAGIQMNNVGAFPEYVGGRNIQWVTQARQIAPPHPTAGAKTYTSGVDTEFGDNQGADGGTFAPGSQVFSRVSFVADHNWNGWGAVWWVGAFSDVQTAGAQGADTRGFPMTDPMICDTWDVSTLKISSTNIKVYSDVAVPSDYIVEYGIGSNAVNTQAGPKTGGYFPVTSTSQTADATDCRSNAYQWVTDPTTLGADWQDKVNMVRLRPKTTGYVEHAGFDLNMRIPLTVRSVYNGGPNGGQKILTGVRITNTGSYPQNDTSRALSTQSKQMYYTGMLAAVNKDAQAATWLPGQDAKWTMQFGINKGQVGALMERPQIIDTIPAGLTYNDTCTKQTLPAGSTTSYNPVSRELVITLPDIRVAQTDYWVYTFTLCTTIPTSAQPGTSYVNHVSARSLSSENTPTDQATTSASGSGQMGIDKSVDKPLVESGETYTWKLEWVNTSRQVEFAAPDIIDVLPWNGDGAAGALSKRDQYASDYTGTSELTGPLAPPTYTQGNTGDVPGTWYYATAPYATIDPNPKSASNADPAAAGGLWKTAAEISDFSTVTAIRFVSSQTLTVTTRVAASIPMVGVDAELGSLYVNRAMIYSATVANQQLLSTEPTVLVPGFSVGDLVWLDKNLDGRHQPTEAGIPDVTIELLDDAGDVVATTTTDAAGRWHVDLLPAGTYRARIPASEFQAGGPLATYIPSPSRNGDAAGANESASNNNTSAPNPQSTGLVSSPITLSYVRDGSDRLTGGTGTGNDVAGLTPQNLPESFTDYTIDLALAPVGGVDIEKHTNTKDADEPTGPLIAVGGPVEWTYLVTNTGETDLFDVTVTDDQVAASRIDCGDTGGNVIPGPLAPGATFTCVATGLATVGQYANTGTVQGNEPPTFALDGTPFDDIVVDDDDPSHYFGIDPSVDIEKATNGQDADTPTGPLIPVGGTVRWTYVVTNTGNAALTDVTVTDDKVAAADIDCDGTGSNVVPGRLEPGESFECVAEGVATLGQYANLGSVVGTAPETTDVDGNPVAGETVDDEDPSHYFGIQPAVDIEKATNGQDADAPTGPLVAEGGDVEWVYVVTNTGNVPLTDVTVTDDVEDAAGIDCDETGSNVIAGPLAPGDSFTCIATGEAISGQYANLGTVTGIGPETTDVDGETVDGAEVTDDDPSHYFGTTPEVDIEKHTNGQDADEPTGPYIPVGGDVRWTYVVTNTGNAALTDVTVTDDQVDAAEIDCAGTGSNVIPGPVAPGGTFTCVASGIATRGQYANLGTVTGVGPETTDVDGNPVAGVAVDDDDPSHYFGIEPAIDIEKATNTLDADEPTGPIVNVGGAVRWTYVVTNTGNVRLTDVTVTDDLVDASDIVCEGADGNVVAELDAGESVECTAEGTAVVGQYANLGSVTGVGPEMTDADGNAVAGTEVTDDDPSHYFGVLPAVDIEKSVNGRDADEPTGPFVAVGGDVRWIYVVTNVGTADLTDVTVTDDMLDSSEIDCADTGSNVVPGPLAPGASFTCVATGTAISGQYANTGTVVGTGPETTDVEGGIVPGLEVTDEDVAHYFGATPAVDIEKATNGEDADEPTGPSIVAGDDVEWTYVVTNTGDVSLTDVTVTDDRVAASRIDCADTGSNVVPGPLAPGDSFTCTAQGSAVEGQYANLGTVTATGPMMTDVDGEPVDGETVTDEDWSHYFGTPVPVPGVPLANTGGAGGTPVVAGLLLLAGGLLFVLMARRRRVRPGRE